MTPVTYSSNIETKGAYRMRGIGKGQRVRLCIIPEVANRILDDLKAPDNGGDPIGTGMRCELCVYS